MYLMMSLFRLGGDLPHLLLVGGLYPCSFREQVKDLLLGSNTFANLHIFFGVSKYFCLSRPIVSTKKNCPFMSAVGKKFGPLIQRGIFRVEKYFMLLH